MYIYIISSYKNGGWYLRNPWESWYSDNTTLICNPSMWIWEKKIPKFQLPMEKGDLRLKTKTIKKLLKKKTNKVWNLNPISKVIMAFITFT